jgi:DNA polymerase-3 subunit delta
MPVISSLNSIQDKEFPKVILLFGEERFLLEEDYEAILRRLIPDEQSAYDLDLLDGNDCDLNRIVDSCLSYPFVSEKRVVVVNHFEKLADKHSKKEDVHGGFTRYLDKPQDSTILIIKSDISSINGVSKELQSTKNKSKAERKLALLKFPYDKIIKQYPCVEYAKIHDSEYERWINNRFKSSGKRIDPSAVELLIAHTNPDLREIYHEIQKLAILVGTRTDITIDDVSASLGTNRIYNVFELQNAIGKRDLEKSLMIMQKMLENERLEVLIVTILTRFFINLWRLDEVIKQNNNQYVIASSIGISPYFVSEYTDSLRRYKLKEIEKAIKLLASTDEKMKSASVSPKYLLETLFIDIMD